jgi:beta-N-acetylhexosaminidase
LPGGETLKRPPRAAIFGCAGARLSDAEHRFFAAAEPLGFILFARNCPNPDATRALVRDLRATVGRTGAPVLIDQEGGRVQRLKPPHWRPAPPAARFGAIAAGDPEAAGEAAYANARLIAAELIELGIDVDCAPVADLRLPGAHDIIGDRACGSDPAAVARLARATCRGLIDGGVLPVIKHIPGHGRATVDSHHALPRVEVPLAELDRTDFEAFRRLADMPWAMTAHVVYTAIDSERPATLSPTVIGEVIRGRIGFDGFLVSDDLAMKALSGDAGDLAAEAIAAGCDAVLHCTGNMGEMERIAAKAPRLGEAALARLDRGRRLRPTSPPGDDLVALGRRLDAILAMA